MLNDSMFSSSRQHDTRVMAGIFFNPHRSIISKVYNSSDVRVQSAINPFS